MFDLPEAVPLAREVVGATGVADRMEVVAGDFFADPLPPGDLYALGRILHDWSEEKIVALLGRSTRRCRPGGGAGRREAAGRRPGRAAVGAVAVPEHAGCTEGKERTLGEYAALLKQVGFADVTGVRTPSPLDAVLAVKK